MPMRPVDHDWSAAHSTANAPAAPVDSSNTWLSPVEHPVPGTLMPITA